MTNMEFEPGSDIRPSDPEVLKKLRREEDKLNMEGNPEFERHMQELENVVDNLEVRGYKPRLKEIMGDMAKKGLIHEKLTMQLPAGFPLDLLQDYLEVLAVRRTKIA